MITPRPRTAMVATLAIISAILTSSSVSAQDTPAPYDCAKVSVSGNSYDISALKKYGTPLFLPMLSTAHMSKIGSVDTTPNSNRARTPLLCLGCCFAFPLFLRTYLVKGEATPVYPNKQRVDYFVNPCQAITVPESEVKQHCVAGAWVCQDTKVIFDDGEPKTLSLLPIAGTAPAADGVPAREVAPLAVLADKIENVAEGMLNTSLFVFVVGIWYPIEKVDGTRTLSFLSSVVGVL